MFCKTNANTIVFDHARLQAADGTLIVGISGCLQRYGPPHHSVLVAQVHCSPHKEITESLIGICMTFFLHGEGGQFHQFGNVIVMSSRPSWFKSTGPFVWPEASSDDELPTPEHIVNPGE